MIFTETEKLYSPLEFFLRDKEDARTGVYDDIDYWRDELSHEEAFGYLDAIELAVRRDRDRMDKALGMAEYIPNSLDDIVVSMFPSVELHGDKLWCVADVMLSRPITPGEMGELTQWWSGQLSDGWGEGISQREIPVDRGELYMEIWTPDDSFFIDTEREFRQRLGLEPLAVETPAQAALHEPDIYDDKATAALREQLTARIDENLLSYFEDIRGNEELSIPDMTSEIAAVTGAHYYLLEIHNFHASELEYLLRFQDPLAVVADAFQVAGMDDYSDVMWNIFDKQDALQGDYPLVNDAVTAVATPEKDSPVTLDELFEKIAKKHCRFETLEARNRDSLDFHEVSVWGLKAALEEAYAAGLTQQIAQTKGADKSGAVRDETRQERASAEKPSVLDRIREAAKAPKEPPKEKPARDKSGPEL